MKIYAKEPLYVLTAYSVRKSDWMYPIKPNFRVPNNELIRLDLYI